MIGLDESLGIECGKARDSILPVDIRQKALAGGYVFYP
jgi:hypothetical protein